MFQTHRRIHFFLRATGLTIGSLCATFSPGSETKNGFRLLWQSKLDSKAIGESGLEYFQPRSAPGWSISHGLTGMKGSKSRMVDGVDRLSIGRAPDGRVALRVRAPKGEVQNFNFRTNHFDALEDIVSAKVAVDIWLPDGMSWGHDQKLALGLWGGGEATCYAGGCPPEKQDGFCVRPVHSPEKGAALYSYHLNRTKERNEKGNIHGIATGGSTGPLPTGRWVTLELEVTMNDLDRENGLAQLRIDGRLTGEMPGLVFRTSEKNWRLRGMICNDMWGGTEEDPIRFSPREQVYWYSNYRLWVKTGK